MPLLLFIQLELQHECMQQAIEVKLHAIVVIKHVNSAWFHFPQLHFWFLLQQLRLWATLFQAQVSYVRSFLELIEVQFGQCFFKLNNSNQKMTEITSHWFELLVFQLNYQPLNLFLSLQLGFLKITLKWIFYHLLLFVLRQQVADYFNYLGFDFREQKGQSK